MTFALLALMLILPVSALAARRLPLGATLKLALVWVAIFAGVFVAIMLGRTVYLT